MDVSTLFFVEASLLFLFSLTMVVNSIGQSGQACNYWFAASNFCGGVGLLVHSTFPTAPALFTVLAGSFLFFVELALLNKAIAEFVGRGRTVWLYLLAMSVLITLVSAHLALTPENHTVRIALNSVVAATTAICSAILVFHSLRDGAKISTIVMGTLLSLYATTNTVRLLTIRSFPQQSFYHIWLDRTIIAGLSFGFLWMTAARLRNRLEKLAGTDALTGVLNRRAIEDGAERLFARSRQRNRAVAALMLDIDCFKQINDNFGHHAGDLALCTVADCLRQNTRGGDLIARLGGDEFFIIMPNTDVALAQAVADRIQANLAELVVHCDTGGFAVRASIGVTSSGSNFSLEDLLKLGDRALYSAKATNRRQTSAVPHLVRSAPEYASSFAAST